MNKLPIKVTFIPFIPFIVVANSNVLDVKTKNKTLTPKKFFKTLLQFDDASNLMIKKYQGQKVFDTTTPKKKKKKFIVLSFRGIQGILSVCLWILDSRTYCAFFNG